MRAPALQTKRESSDKSSRQTGDAGRMQTNTDTNRNSVVVERKTISIMKACELVGVSRRTIYNWIAGGKVEYVRTAGGSVRIFVDTLWRQPSRSSDLATKEAS